VSYPANSTSGMDDPIAGDQLKSIVERIERAEEEAILDLYLQAVGETA
jgi:uncharacterized protein (UPF0335 family)